MTAFQPAMERPMRDQTTSSHMTMETGPSVDSRSPPVMPPMSSPPPEQEDGRGSRLITAFASQLDAAIDRTHDDARFRLSVRFHRQPLEQDGPGT